MKMTRRDLDNLRLCAKCAMTLDNLIDRDNHILLKHPDRVEIAKEIEILRQKRDEYRENSITKFLDIAKDKPLNEAEFTLGIMYYGKGLRLEEIMMESGYSERWVYNTLVNIRDKLDIPHSPKTRQSYIVNRG